MVPNALNEKNASKAPTGINELANMPVGREREFATLIEVTRLGANQRGE